MCAVGEAGGENESAIAGRVSRRSSDRVDAPTREQPVGEGQNSPANQQRVDGRWGCACHVASRSAEEALPMASHGCAHATRERIGPRRGKVVQRHPA